MRKLADPVIVIPGITASYLNDTYALPPEPVWTVLSKSYERATLHPNNLKYEKQLPARVEPGQVFEMAYRELIEELRQGLRSSALPTTWRHPVYPFSYDWRQPLQATVAVLDAFVDEVVERTRLQREFVQDGYSGKVNLVAHSMGGLIVAGLLAKGQDSASRINRVVTLATPFRGSYEAVLKITTGLGVINGEEPKAREREAARLTPSLYHLIPSFEAALGAPKGYPNSFFDPRAWQPSVTKTLQKYIDEVSVENLEAQSLFRKLLETAANFLRDSVYELDLKNIGVSQDNWLCVVGVGAKTNVKMDAEVIDGELRYILTSKNQADDYAKSRKTGKWGVRTGDGTVPYLGAVPPFMDLERIVCVTPDDFGTWEVQDRLLSATVGGFHGILPNMNMLHRMVITFFEPGGVETKTVAPTYIWGRPAPTLEDPTRAWNPPFSGLRNKATS